MVAFSAYLTNDMSSVPNYRTIIFDEVQTNVGNAYNGKTGIFNCQTPGVYAFYWVVTNKDHTYMDSSLSSMVKNTAKLSQMQEVMLTMLLHPM